MDEASITLFLGGDVMTGRGIDQMLARPSGPELHEPFVTDAREYLRLAEQVSGPVPRSVASGADVFPLAERANGPASGAGDDAPSDSADASQSCLGR